MRLHLIIYLSRNKMIGIPEMGRQCYALIDAMFIETMYRHLVERRQELTWSHRHTCARGRHPVSTRGKWRLMCILDFFNMKTLLQLLFVQKLISSMCVLLKNNLLQGDTVPLIKLYNSWIRNTISAIVPVSVYCILFTQFYFLFI